MITGFEDYTHELNHEEKLMKPFVIALLSQAKKPMTNNDLINYFDDNNIQTSAPRIRKIIHDIRVKNELPLLLSSKKGYYVSYEDKDVSLYLKSLEERIKSISVIHYQIQKQYERFCKTRDNTSNKS